MYGISQYDFDIDILMKNTECAPLDIWLLRMVYQLLLVPRVQDICFFSPFTTALSYHIYACMYSIDGNQASLESTAFKFNHTTISFYFAAKVFVSEFAYLDR